MRDKGTAAKGENDGTADSTLHYTGRREAALVRAVVTLAAGSKMRRSREESAGKDFSVVVELSLDKDVHVGCA